MMYRIQVGNLSETTCGEHVNLLSDFEAYSFTLVATRVNLTTSWSSFTDTMLCRDINFVIMDYLISEGYPRAAEKFAKEANMQLPVEEESIQARVEIRKAIHAGDIDTAINKINDLNPQVSLHFPFRHPSLV